MWSRKNTRTKLLMRTIREVRRDRKLFLKREPRDLFYSIATELRSWLGKRVGVPR